MNIKPNTAHAAVLDRALACYLRYLDSPESLRLLSQEEAELQRRCVRELQERRNREIRRTFDG